MFALARYLVLVGGLIGVMVMPALLVLPLMTYCATVAWSEGAGIPTETCVSSNLIASQGGRLELVTWLYLGAMTLLALGAAALGWRASRDSRYIGRLILTVGLILLIGVALAGFSIGMYYALPTVLVLVGGAGLTLAAFRAPRSAF